MTDEYIPGDAELRAARAALDDVLIAGGVSLDEAALWIDPGESVEEEILGAMGTRAADRRRRRLLVSAAAVAASVIVLAAGLVMTRSAGPDWEIPLFATQEAPGASGVAKGWLEPSGTRVELEITGLAPAPDGSFYELWFSDGPVHVSAGTFLETTDLTLWTGVSRRDFPRVWITLEPIDDDPGPGSNVLDSELPSV